MSGEFAIQTPPCPTAMPLGIFRPSMNTENLSALPSPSVSSRILTRSFPGPASRRGYSNDSVIQNRPRSSIVIDTGFTMSGSDATSSTLKPSGTTIFAIASAGLRAGPGGLSCACGMRSSCAKQERHEATIRHNGRRENKLRIEERSGNGDAFNSKYRGRKNSLRQTRSDTKFLMAAEVEALACTP